MCNYIFINFSGIAFEYLNIEKIIGISLLFSIENEIHIIGKNTQA